MSAVARWSTWAGILITFAVSLTFGQVLYLFQASSAKEGHAYLAGGIEY